MQEVLDEMHEAGLNIIYNTREIPPTARIGAEPVGTTPVEIAREILAALGFRLETMGNDVYSAVPDPRSAARRRRPAASPGGAEAAGGPPALEELVVTTSRYSLSTDQPEIHTFLTQSELEALPKLADEPLRALQRLPGSAATSLSAQAHIRGGEYDEMLMLVDGFPVHEPFHLKNFLNPVSVFDARAMDSMDVYSGGFTANYGDRMSGVVDISSLTPPRERYTELGLSLWHASALSAGTFNDSRGDWLASVRRSNLDLIAHAFDSDVGEPEYFDAFGRIRYALSDATTLFASVLSSGDEISANTSDETETTDAEYRNTYVWGGVEQRLGATLSARLILGLTDVDNDRVGEIDQPGEHEGAVQDDREFRMGIAKLDFTHELPRLFTRFGLEAREMSAEYRYHSRLFFAPDFPFPGDPGKTVVRDLAPEPDGHQYAAYLTTRLRPMDRLGVELGLRWDDHDYDDVGGPTQLSPRLNVLLDLTETTRVRAAWGRFWQAQGINELQVEDGVDTFYEPQRVDHAIASLEQSLPWDVSLRVEAYYKDYDRVRPHYENLFDPLKLMPELEPDRVRVAPDGSRSRGVELSLAQRALGPWSWWLNYGWSRVSDDIEDRDVPRSWDQRHTLNAGIGWSGEHWDFALTDTYHTGWPTTELVLVTDPGTGTQTAVASGRNAVRYKDYNSVDFRAVRRWALEESDLEAFFEVSNIFAERNPCCTEYEVSGSPAGGLAIDRDWDYWPKMVPSFGVLWRF